MIKNNIELDVKVKCMEEGITQAQLAEKVGTSAPYLNRVIKNTDGVVNKTFVSMMDQLGYDIEIIYIKK
ncbi:MAG: helix-turn-helix transcriptional regulator [Lachnospiraceae bacterium]|nr:helix-turn-helix transcriptional regulator [Lachnospiraceae bacterium]